MLYRVAAEDVALSPNEPHRKLVARGSYVVNVQWLANFDPKAYSSPWRLSPERFENADGRTPCPPPLLFGAGVHRCLAEHLGHAMIREMIRALFAQPGVRRVDGPEGTLQPGEKGTIPYGNFAQRMLVCFDA
jgi:cytochrome P450